MTATLKDTIQRVTDKLEDPEYQETEHERAGEREAHDRASNRRRMALAADNLWSERGCRYRDCTLDNFVAQTQAQRSVLAEVRKYADHLAENVQAGTNVLLTGPHGTGKDHLLAGLMHVAVKDFTIKWTSGAKLWARCRDAIGSETTEERLLSEYSRKPGVLVLSDPLPVTGSLTRYQADTLYAIVDERYNRRGATWCSLNAANKAEADARIGAAIIDRLRDGALSLVCNWESYRKSCSASSS